MIMTSPGGPRPRAPGPDPVISPSRTRTFRSALGEKAPRDQTPRHGPTIRQPLVL